MRDGRDERNDIVACPLERWMTGSGWTGYGGHDEHGDVIVCPFERRTTGSGWTGSGWTGYGGHGEDVAGRRWWCKGGARDKGRLWGKDWRGAGADDVSYDYPRRRRKTEGNADKRVRG